MKTLRKSWWALALFCAFALGGVMSASAVTAPPVPTPSCTYNTRLGYINVSWSRVSGATYGYYVYRSTSSSWSTRTYLTSTTSTSINDHTVVDGRKYYYWVCPKFYWSGTSYWYAYNTSKYNYGMAKTVTVPTPSATTTHENYVKLTWTPDSSTAPYGYYIRRGTSSSYSSSSWLATVSSGSRGYYYDYSASKGVTYYYWVCPRYYKTGSTYYYCYSTSKYDWGKRPNDIVVPRPVASISYSDYVKVTWTASPSSVYGYYIRRGTSSSHSSSSILTRITSSSTTTYYDRNATPGVTYYYWVCPIYSYTGSSYWYYYNTSNWDYGRRTSPVVPDPYATVGYNGYVRVTWTASSSSVYGYYIRRGTSSSYSSSSYLARVNSPSTTTYYDYSARPGVTYYYWVCPIYSYTGSSYWFYYNTSLYDWGRCN